ncbi:MAG: hypothetical protein ABFS35_16570 [Bacteroidota bacterium]
MNILKIVVFFFLITININAQKGSIGQLEDSIQSLFTKIIATKNDNDKLKYNSEIEKLFNEVLLKKSTFEHPFHKLKNVSKLSSDDGLLRIFTWNLPYNNGTYEYFGFIQVKSKNKHISLFKLSDKSNAINTPQNKVLDNDSWYGTLYYKILTNTNKSKTYYTLFGWDGNDNFTNKKIIEILTIKSKKPQFGSPILKMGNKTHSRIIFEYAKQAKMMLRYDEQEKLIVFDHLAPSLKKFKGQYMYYGPDLSQDGLQFIDGYWILKPNLDMRNKENSNKKPIKTSY